MPVINKNVLFVNTRGATLLTPMNLEGVSVSVIGWNRLTPNNLSAITDGYTDTATGWGCVIDGPNRAFFEIDLGVDSRYIVAARIGIRMAEGWERGEGIWFIEASPTPSPPNTWPARSIPAWAIKFRPTRFEKVGVVPAWVSGRYLRIGAEDAGHGYVELRVYDLKVWTFSAP
ncbi:hypothetical protein [Microseira wollei]|uniref:F5/8 type C domain-containing protein n=1 Tax=Microseira wollei NIES-4236 TaxID=2530354 RepID=A0AAV3XPE5_9CYAN|nr:hypothetical protein [Microseira wollei]GET44223.1 hypothetical protein MiSe_90490 [Microseira wollei NIES-4236]